MDCKFNTSVLVDGNTSYTLITSQKNLNAAYTLTITDTIASTYKYIIVMGGGGNNDGTCSTSLTLSGSQIAVIDESKNSTLSSSKAVSCRIAIISGFVAGDTITTKPNYWGSAIFYGVA